MSVYMHAWVKMSNGDAYPTRTFSTRSSSWGPRRLRSRTAEGFRAAIEVHGKRYAMTGPTVFMHQKK